jgi:hypothetical protein
MLRRLRRSHRGGRGGVFFDDMENNRRDSPRTLRARTATVGRPSLGRPRLRPGHATDPPTHRPGVRRRNLSLLSRNLTHLEQTCRSRILAGRACDAGYTTRKTTDERPRENSRIERQPAASPRSQWRTAMVFGISTESKHVAEPCPIYVQATVRRRFASRWLRTFDRRLDSSNERLYRRGFADRIGAIIRVIGSSVVLAGGGIRFADHTGGEPPPEPRRSCEAVPVVELWSAGFV